ncbi:MAG: apolipoprotein N-acyltransferase [Betaproteobacteria bacterium]|nr:MAG: apolipoprotein N-acyltransferase [Betaproteobacteria bacterium]
MAALGVAFAAGALAVPGFAPFELFPLAFAALVVLIHLWLRVPSPRAAFVTGFAFGCGFFLAGVSWVYVSMHRFGGMPAALAVVATLLFCAFLALFPALAGALQAPLRAPPAVRAALAIPALWTLTEWLRGWILTGFPWLSFGYAAIDWPLAGYAPVAGVYAVTLACIASAGLLWCVVRGSGRWRAAAALALIVGGGAALRALEWSSLAGEPLGVSLLQGNIAQDLKFDPARYGRTLETYARLAGGSRARLSVLPETALPRFLDRVEPEYLARLEAIARGNRGDLLVGAPTRTAPGTYFNSVLSFGSAPRQAYHKVHLVPFGEFIPPGFAWVNQVLAFPLSDFSRGSPQQRPLAVAGERVAVNICYEDAFGAEIRRQLPEATLLVNVSNVAWFGDSFAPAQHLQMARMRSLETARMLLAATNSGITAVVDRDARVLARLPQFVEGRLDATARGYEGTTPYVRFGDWLALGACVALLALAFALARRMPSR